jgi:hypothetical protein
MLQYQDKWGTNFDNRQPDKKRSRFPQSCPGGGGTAPPNTYCFKVVDRIGICGTYEYQAAIQSDAERAARQSTPGCNVTPIDCCQMSAACSQ